jgi:gluconolactonase
MCQIRQRWVCITLGILIGSSRPGILADEVAEKLVAPGAQVVELADGFLFTEGPACDADGNIFFTDIPNNRVLKWDVSQRKLSTFRDESGGANGLYFDQQGNLLACEGGNRRLTSIAPDGTVKVLVGEFGSKKLNSPNDLWIDPDGGVYFTDPRYGREEGLQQDGFHVYYLKPNRRDVVRVIDDLTKPNGVVGTADGKILYVADPGSNRTFAYTMRDDGSLADRKLIAESGSDGMTLDEQGNLYLTAGRILVYSPEGTELGAIEVPQRPSNVCFGAKGSKTLYITARSGFYSLKMQVDGQ